MHSLVKYLSKTYLKYLDNIFIKYKLIKLTKVFILGFQIFVFIINFFFLLNN